MIEIKLGSDDPCHIVGYLGPDQVADPGRIKLSLRLIGKVPLDLQEARICPVIGVPYKGADLVAEFSFGQRGKLGQGQVLMDNPVQQWVEMKEAAVLAVVVLLQTGMASGARGLPGRHENEAMRL